MARRRCHGARAAGCIVLGLGALAGAARAQMLDPGDAAGRGAGADFWRLGASQGFTHDSNVDRAPGGEGATLSSSSVFGDFERRFGRQRVFGRGVVSVNRYFDRSEFDNTSYELATGVDWETVNRLSGTVDATLGRSLSRPAAAGTAADTGRNIARTESLRAVGRWGGESLLTLVAALRYANVDQSSAAAQSQEARTTGASVGVYARPRGVVSGGVFARVDRTRSASAVVDPVTGNVEANTVQARSVDLVGRYEASPALIGRARLSYTRLSNSNDALAGGDFSGLTGGVGVDYRPTGKLVFSLYADREANFNPALDRGLRSPATTPPGDPPVPAPTTPTTQAGYERNRVTDLAGLNAEYLATAKITAVAGVRYARAQLVASTAAGPADATDVQKIATIGARYEINRAVGLRCDFGHESRRVSGAFAYSYSANTVGCQARFVWQ